MRRDGGGSLGPGGRILYRRFLGGTFWAGGWVWLVCVGMGKWGVLGWGDWVCGFEWNLRVVMLLLMMRVEFEDSKAHLYSQTRRQTKRLGLRVRTKGSDRQQRHSLDSRKEGKQNKGTVRDQE